MIPFFSLRDQYISDYQGEKIEKMRKNDDLKNSFSKKSAGYLLLSCLVIKTLE